MNTRINMMNFNVDNLSMQETLLKIEEIIKERQPTQHVVVNASKAVMIQKDEKLRSIINECPLINADGQSIVWASKFLGKPLAERVAGIDLMEEIIQLSAKKGYSIYFFGAKEEVVKEVVKLYEYKYPTLKVAGYRNGYFKEEDNEKIVSDIKNSNADILFVAFSSPKKEYWLKSFCNEMNIPFQMGVGGSFDVVAGITKRAPRWMQKVGMEWFYRFMQEPKRMWKRYLIGNLKFVSYVVREKWGNSKL
ncbi:glycosyltransferase [Bacillus cereus]|uniref:WecB/TagA/CpsF family glycosyltransferase n=1 Tax=Bacillus nitratireducens TaxID=2026193 RepID=UPI000BEDEA9D|nr:glycosyltransferase [Bacillus cereus]PEX97961.1 glycosyltransferase [Bacillus cereus]PFK10512.1 glycosyltransferase [Bacillus cereus]PFP59890.1 glycosyltransferase [Bacillus cereus]PFV23741.1 glycosyltransferase [Bacillus cereus]